MCGIAGFFSLNRFDELQPDLPAAAESLSHRGPDDAGIYLFKEKGVGLAHRRLSIIDLSNAGRQPMFNDDGSLAIVYNGEIYNFMALRDELSRCGYAFRSGTDTEVILKAYHHWGVECLSRFIGMFAIAIWDNRSGKLFLGRDRIGIKPLYFYFDRNAFLFGSELKALMAFRSFPRDLRPEAIPLFLHYQYIPAPLTIFQHTWKLRPGNYLIFDGRQVVSKPYWRLPEGIPPGKSSLADENEAIERLDSLISQAVSDRLVSDVPIGALLSGGIDSSLVAAMMCKSANSTVKTFTIGFSEGSYDEAPWARKIAEHLGTSHTELYVRPDTAMAVIGDIAHYYDEPFADSSAIPTILVSRLTRAYVTVALSGDGGDEQFAGYARYWMTRGMARWFDKWPESVRTAVAGLLQQIPPGRLERIYLPIRPKMPPRLQVANFEDKWQKLLDAMSCRGLCELYRTTVCLWPRVQLKALVGADLPASLFEDSFAESAEWSVLSQLMRVDQQTYLPDCMLAKVDRASMANGLEVRVPLLDHRIVEFTSRLPERMKHRNGGGKYLLKKVLANYVPPQLFERPKMGFAIPLGNWLRNELKHLMRDYLSRERLKREGRFKASVVERAIQEHLSGRSNHQHRLWALLVWQMWHEKWMGK